MSMVTESRVFTCEQRLNELEKHVGTLDKDQMLLVFNLMRDEMRKLSERVLKLEQKRG